MKFQLRNDDKLVNIGSISLDIFKNPHLNMMFSYEVFISFAFEDEKILMLVPTRRWIMVPQCQKMRPK